jgi:hypothetical protein
MAKHGYTPLAKVDKGKTLCASSAQDRYFVVSDDGKSRAIDVQEAVQLYLRAAEQESNLVWKREPERATGSEKTRAAEEDPVDQWAKNLRRALGIEGDLDE